MVFARFCILLFCIGTAAAHAGEVSSNKQWKNSLDKSKWEFFENTLFHRQIRYARSKERPMLRIFFAQENHMRSQKVPKASSGENTILVKACEDRLANARKMGSNFIEGRFEDSGYCWVEEKLDKQVQIQVFSLEGRAADSPFAQYNVWTALATDADLAFAREAMQGIAKRRGLASMKGGQR